MTAGNLWHAAQMTGEGEVLQHAYGLDDVFVDLVALLLGEGSPADGKVVSLPPVVEMVRYLDLEAPGIVLVEPISIRTRHKVPALVGQQWLEAGQLGRRFFLTQLELLPADAESIVQGAQPGAAGDGVEPFNLIGGHPLAAQIALGDEGKLLIQFGPARSCFFPAGTSDL